MEDDVTQGIQHVTSIANELVGTCRDLEGRLRESEFLLLTLRREFAAWLLYRMREVPGVEARSLGVQDPEVIALVKRYERYFLSTCTSCRRRAPVNDEGLCAWGCSPRSPQSMAP